MTPEAPMAEKLNKHEAFFARESGDAARPAQFDVPRKRLLSRKEAAHYLNVSLSWLDKSRLSGLGPEYVRIGGGVRYEFSALENFVIANRRSSTSEQKDPRSA